MLNYLHGFSSQIGAIHWLIILINAIIHILFAGAVARDSGELKRRGINTFLVSGMTWAFATLVGGVFVAVAYWFMHRFRLPNSDNTN